MGAAVRYRIKGTKVYVRPVKASVGYEGGSQAPRVARWRPTTGGPNTVLSGSLPLLRSRSRDARRKDGLADNAIETWVTNIVGTGIKPQFATPDKDFNKVLAAAWLEWTDHADADGRFDFYGLQALAVSSTAEGGDCFVRLRTRLPGDGLSVPLQLQLLEGEYCPDEKNEMAASGNFIRCGVEFDLVGRRVAYWLYRFHPADWVVNNMMMGDLMPTRVPASEIVHLALGKRPGMIRGEPWLTRALIKLHELDKFDDAQLVRQQIAALFAGFVKSDTPEGTGDEQELFAAQGSPDSDAVALASLEPGTMQVLPPGKSVEFSEPPEPGNTYEAYMRQQERRVAVAVGVLYEQVSGDYSKTNDRQFRAAVNEFRRRCGMLQHHLVVYQFCRPILLRWAEYAVISGRVSPPAGITVADIARAKWIPQGWAYLNPVQDVQAKKDEVRAGFASRAEKVSERGYDVEEMDQEIAADNERADELGLIFDSDPRRTAGSGANSASAKEGGDRQPDDQERDPANEPATEESA